MLKFAVFAAAAVLAVAVAAPASAAITHATNNQAPASGKSTSGENANPYNPNCFPTAISHVVKCIPPKKTNSPATDCYCSEIRVRTKAGVIVKKVRCTEFRVQDIVQIRIVAEDCGSVRRLPRKVAN
jgi:hypothetical protein